MVDEGSYGIGFFLAGNYHILCREGKVHRFHKVEPLCALEPAKLKFFEARKFIETHPLCSNIAKHDIRIMPFSVIRDILEGRSPASVVKSFSLSEEEVIEERLH